MRVVDPHVHFWDPAVVPISWLSHAVVAYSGDNRLLPKRFTPDELKEISGDIEVSKAVHVEAIADDAVAEARWVQSLAAPLHGQLGIVAYADLSSASFVEHLDRLRELDRLRGVRQVLNRHKNPMYAYTAHDYLTNSAWERNLGELEKLHLSFDLQMYPSQSTEAARVIRRHPEIVFVLNHAGMFVDRNTVIGWRAWRDEIAELSRCANVVVKISGLAMFDHGWTIESFRPYVLEVINAFGPSRCMFASNFPIDGLHSSYSALWHAYANIVSGLRADERDALFLHNAERIYRL